MKRLLLAASLLVASSASAEPLIARDQAAIVPRGRWSVGVIDPLRIGLSDRVEVDTNPIVTLLLSPNVVARIAFRKEGALRVTGEYGLSIPTFVMRLTQGYLFPKWEQGGGRIPFIVVPSVGLVVSHGDRNVITGRIDTAIGIPFARNDAHPLETHAPLELLLAPATTGMRSRIGLAYDHAITDWLRARVDANVWMIGRSPSPPRSQLIYSASIALDLRLGERSRLSLGAVLFDHDQRRTEIVKDEDGYAKRVFVRSRDVWPMLDLVYVR